MVVLLLIFNWDFDKGLHCNADIDVRWNLLFISGLLLPDIVFVHEDQLVLDHGVVLENNGAVEFDVAFKLAVGQDCGDWHLESAEVSVLLLDIFGHFSDMVYFDLLVKQGENNHDFALLKFLLSKGHAFRLQLKFEQLVPFWALSFRHARSLYELLA